MLTRSALFAVICLLFMVCGCATVPRTLPSGPQVASPAAGLYHTVTAGQTLWRISRIYGVDLQALKSANRITDPTQLAVGQRLLIPAAPPASRPSPESARRIDTAAVEKALKTSCSRKTWKTITIHHSGTATGNAASFDRYHRRRRMGGLYYHFVIGNGRGSADGTIETGWRWRKQCEVNRPKDIQICLVGNFDRQEVSEKQFSALLKLVTALRRQSKILPSGVRFHRQVSRKPTHCPGSNFPYARFTSAVRGSS